MHTQIPMLTLVYSSFSSQLLDIFIHLQGGDTALILACVGGHREVVKALLLHGDTNINLEYFLRSPYGATALTVASAGGHIDIVNELLACPGLSLARKVRLPLLHVLLSFC